MWPFTTARADGQLDNPPGSAYQFTFRQLMGGKPLPLADYKGKVLLIVNTASHCGFTPQYEGLEKLYSTYKEQGLVIIGVPSNDFGQQEPGSSEEIATFCKTNYGVTFSLAGKEVVSGSQAHPFFLWARKVLGFGSAPKWNFHKYLINRKGQIVDYYNSMTGPDSQKITSRIEGLLKEQP